MNPIFILSLPRAGSTLLQRLVAANSYVKTVPEPWLCLPLVYSIKNNVFAEYGHKAAQKGIGRFLKELPGGRVEYLHRLGELVLSLYRDVAQPDTLYFLDKTPRYHYILNELFEMFPDGKFIFLWRNPLSILSSYVEYFDHGRWMPDLYGDDLKDGLASLCDAYTKYADRSYAVSYERLVRNVTEEVTGIHHYLQLPGEPNVMLGKVDMDGLGDEKARASDRVDVASAEKWRNVLSNKVRARWALGYLDWLGPERLKLMGYDLEDLKSQLADMPANYRDCLADIFTNEYAKFKDYARHYVLQHG